MIDPQNIEQRLDSLGYLKPSFEIYLKNWKIIWDVNQYIKDLPVLEKEFNIIK